MTSRFFSLSLLALLASALFFAGTGFSEEGAKQKKELPKSGVLSRSLSGGFQGTEVSLPWGKGESPTDKAPVSGSVSRTSQREWTAKVINGSKDTYSVDLRVDQFSKGGSKTKSDSFSFTLKGGESKSRPVAAQLNSIDAQLTMTKWRNLSAEKRKKEEAAEAKKENKDKK